MFAAGRGSCFALQFRRILANPDGLTRGFGYRKKNTESSTWSVYGTEWNEGVSVGVLLAAKEKGGGSTEV